MPDDEFNKKIFERLTSLDDNYKGVHAALTTVSNGLQKQADDLSQVLGYVKNLAEGGTLDDIKKLRDEIALLDTKNRDLLDRIKQLETQRIKPSPTELADSFRDAMKNM